MAEFLVKVADETGRMKEQVEKGYSTEEIRDRFTQQGLLVYSVKPRGLLSGGNVTLPGRKKIKTDQFIIFNSQFLTLMPGDIITTGTPPGVGTGMKPPQYLNVGDVVTLGIEGLGEQRQEIVEA